MLSKCLLSHEDLSVHDGFLAKLEKSALLVLIWLDLKIPTFGFIEKLKVSRFDSRYLQTQEALHYLIERRRLS